MSFAIMTTIFGRGKMFRRCIKCEWVRVVLFGVVTLGVMWLLHRLRLYCHTHPLDRRCEVTPIIVKTQQSGGVLINYNSAYWSSKGDKLHLRVNRTKGATSTGYEYNYSSRDPRSLDPEEKSPAQRLHRILSHPTTSCRKLIRVGGRSCLGAYDGSKLVCLDEEAGLVPRNCLIYSFGIGHDFTFDEHMQDLGCEVHAFDHDADHEIYDYRLGPTAFFHHARIGSQTGYMKSCDDNGDTCAPLIKYLTLADITKFLGHSGRRLSYLKMDIESEEWSVMNQILSHQPSTATLASTPQISLEIHLELRKKTLTEKREVIASSLATLEALTSLGFRLLTYEENEFNPQYETIDGAHLALYAEILLLHTNHSLA